MYSSGSMSRTPKGQLTNWTLESAAPIYLEHLGWTRHSLKAGDTVTIRAYIAKDQANMAKTDAVTLPGGRVVTTGRAVDSRDSWPKSSRTPFARVITYSAATRGAGVRSIPPARSKPPRSRLCRRWW